MKKPSPSALSTRLIFGLPTLFRKSRLKALRGYIDAQCVQCPTPQGLNWHLFDIHGLSDPVRSLVQGTVCKACMQEYGSRERLVRHVSTTSPRCARFYFECCIPYSIQDTEKLDEEARAQTRLLAKKGLRRVHAAHPPVRVEGPMEARAFELGISFIFGLKNGPGRRRR